MYYPRFTKVIIHHFLTKDKTISKRNKIGMHTSRDDYLINTLRFVSEKEESQIYGARLPKSMTTSPEEPIRKSKRVKRPTKKSSDAPTAGVVIRETPVKSLSKKNEKITVEKHKGIDLLSKVALTEQAQYEEVRKKSLRDFHKTHPSGLGTVTKITPSVAKIKPYITNEGTCVKPGVPDVTKEESTESEAESWGKDEDKSNNDHDSKSEGNSEHETDENETGSESDQQEENEEDVEDDEDETNVKDKTEGDEYEGMDYTTNQFDDDVNTPTLLTIPVFVISDSSPVYSTVIPQSLQSFTPPPPQSTLTPPPTTKATNPLSTLLNFASVFQFNNRVTTLEKEVSELKKNDPLNTQVTALVDEHLDLRLGSTRDEFMNYLSTSITARIIESRKDKDKDEDPSVRSDRGLMKRKTSKDAEPTTEELEFEIADSDIPKDQEENPSNDNEEPKVKVASKRVWFTKPKRPQEPTDPDWNEGKTPQQGPTQSWLMTLASSANIPSKTFDELISSPIDFSAYIMNDIKINNLTQETLLEPTFKLLKGTRTNFAKLEYDFEECYKALS
ncbi:hypothetical protein Tco_0417415 [Tanacetum coccineum]